MMVMMKMVSSSSRPDPSLRPALTSGLCCSSSNCPAPPAHSITVSSLPPCAPPSSKPSNLSCPIGWWTHVLCLLGQRGCFLCGCTAERPQWRRRRRDAHRARQPGHVFGLGEITLPRSGAGPGWGPGWRRRGGFGDYQRPWPRVRRAWRELRGQQMVQPAPYLAAPWRPRSRSRRDLTSGGRGRGQGPSTELGLDWTRAHAHRGPTRLFLSC